ncbi:amidohydrolase [Spiractinospora alimapuensis]|uniref:M20 metallopeptidase family protein n=1 Tax=Spiractinospora alimapuensis TaxID=2820884 RepID=UPI001F1B7123|nr:M20 family metallopeptidase [Spiractinospora alimapuensis]QVQ53461.1 amidohydrolase [Spiractinospora alimapuensis]
MTRSLLDDAARVHDRTRALRRTLHAQPEIGLDLPHTRRAVLKEIADLDLPLRLSETTSAVVAELHGANDGPTLILRGDMDALPLTEDTGLPYASAVPGVMHACGHDTHTAMLASAARVLAGRREEIAGRVLFFFQPGEEGYHGAWHALEEGLLDAPDVAGAFALHISTQFPSGTVNVRRGPILASADFFEVTVHGRGGHASAPYRAQDPIPAACEMVTALQVALSRRLDTFDPSVVTVSRITAGTTNNIIPATAELEGTIRCLSQENRELVHSLIRQVVKGVADAHGLTADVTLHLGYPVTDNDADFTDRVRDVAARTVGAERVHELANPLMGAEDFSYLLHRHPGSMAFLGACPPEYGHPDEAPANHSNLVVFDESAMDTGVATYAAVALDHLRPG